MRKIYFESKSWKLVNMGRHKTTGRSCCASLGWESRTSAFQVLTLKKFLDDHIPSTLSQLFQVCPTKAGNSLEKRAEKTEGECLPASDMLYFHKRNSALKITFSPYSRRILISASQSRKDCRSSPHLMAHI